MAALKRKLVASTATVNPTKNVIIFLFGSHFDGVYRRTTFDEPDALLCWGWILSALEIIGGLGEALDVASASRR